MEIKIATVGGFNEVGKNMTAIKVGDEAIILDMGFFLPKLIDFEEEGGEREHLSSQDMIKMGAIPDDSTIREWAPKVKAIVLGHCHLDHIGAAPYLAGKYDCPIIGTPFTLEVLRKSVNDDGLKLKNPLKPLLPGSSLKISDNIEIKFVNITHSTIQTVMVAVKTPRGIILYANDFKFDNHPVLGKKPDYEYLKKIGENNQVLAIVVESLYAYAERKTPSEKVARELLKDVILGVDNKDHAIIITTFASHLSRLRSIIDFAKSINRKVVFFGRSMAKYTYAAETIKFLNFSKEVEIYPYVRQIKKKIQQIEKEGRGKYIIVCTGNQGEPRSVLVKMANGEIPFNFMPWDNVIFSCRTIPVDINLANRAALEQKLKQKHVRIFTEIHVSGHAGREDLRDLLNMVKPKHIFPAHGGSLLQGSLADLAVELNYVLGKNVHISHNGQIFDVR